jgi:hypothetical protein
VSAPASIEWQRKQIWELWEAGMITTLLRDQLLADLLAPKEPSAPKVEGCPKCQHPGRFVRTALVCPHHGPFAGF